MTTNALIGKLLGSLNAQEIYLALTQGWLGARPWEDLPVLAAACSQSFFSPSLLSNSSQKVDPGAELENIGQFVPNGSNESCMYAIQAILLLRGLDAWSGLPPLAKDARGLAPPAQLWSSRGWSSLLRAAWSQPSRLAGKTEEKFWQEHYETLLVPAVQEENWELLEFFLSRGAPLAQSVPGRHASLLRSALSPKMATFLLEKGADPALKDYAGFTPLEHWVYERRTGWLGANAQGAQAQELAEALWQHAAARDQLLSPAFAAYPALLVLLRDYKKLGRIGLAPHQWGNAPDASIHFPAKTPLGVLAYSWGAIDAASPIAVHVWEKVVGETYRSGASVPSEELYCAYLSLCALSEQRRKTGQGVGVVTMLRDQVVALIQAESEDEHDAEIDWHDAQEAWLKTIKTGHYGHKDLAQAFEKAAIGYFNFRMSGGKCLMPDPVEEKFWSSMMRTGNSFRYMMVASLANKTDAKRFWEARQCKPAAFLQFLEPKDLNVVLEGWRQSGLPIDMTTFNASRLLRSATGPVQAWLQQSLLDSEVKAGAPAPRPRM